MNCGVEIDLPYIHAYYDRHGRRRYYYRRKGFARVALPGAPGSPEFMAGYHAANNRPARVEPSLTLGPGSFKALCHEYENSAEFGQLMPSTRREMGYVIAKLVQEHGDKPVALLERRHVLGWRDHLKAKPGAANKMLRTVKVLMSFAIDRGYRNDNPVAGVKLLKVGEWRAWTLEEMRTFELKWPLGSLQRLGYALALYTGQRRADLVKLSFSSISDDSFALTQQKTNASVHIPIHPELRKALPAIYPNDDTPILARHARKSLSPIYFGHLMARAIGDAGLPDECVLHGLRKSAAVALIDAGCTNPQARAITGHKSDRMLEAYAKDRDQAKLGRDAMEKWGSKK